VNGYPGFTPSLENYPQERIEDVFPASKGGLTIRVYGSDLAALRSNADEISQRVADVRGVADARVQQQRNVPSLEVKVDLDSALQAGIKPGDVRRAATTLVSGLVVGSLFQEQKVFDVVVVGTPETRRSLTDIQELPIETPEGSYVRLGDVAQVSVVPGLDVIRHEDVSRYLDIHANVRGRSVSDVAGAVKEALKGVNFPPEGHAELVGDYARRQSEHLRFYVVTVAAAVGVLLLLQAALRSWRLAAATFLALPSALAGGLLIALTHRTVTIGALVGFFSVFAVACRQAMLLVSRFQDLERRNPGTPRQELVERGVLERLLPTVLTALGMLALAAPLLVVGNVAGTEIARPLVVVVLGGLLTSSLFSLVVMPAAYLRFAGELRPDAAEWLSPQIIDLTTETTESTDGEVVKQGADRVAATPAG
jgi:Cu/Ag efflux pump CusA